MKLFTHFDADFSSVFAFNFSSIKAYVCFFILVMFSSIFFIASSNILVQSYDEFFESLFSVLTFIDYLWERIRYFAHAGFDSNHLEFHSGHCLSIAFAMVSCHGGLRYQLWIFSLRLQHNNNSIQILMPVHQRTQTKLSRLRRSKQSLPEVQYRGTASTNTPTQTG